MVRKRTIGITTGAIAATIGLLAVPLSVMADQVILDDLIVDGSACVGQDCVNGESFGFDTIRIKENNLRIKAEDTSNSASFPTQDWQLTFNDSTNGGANKFSIDKIAPSSGTPFTILADARNNAIFAKSSNVGFGTASPVVNLHVVSGNTPTLRLEQDGSSGFTAQTWDVAGNEAGFFVRDATNGSKLPFRIRPGAPSSAIDIHADGDVGLGTSSPETAVDVERPGASRVAIRLGNNSDGSWQIIMDKNGDPNEGISFTSENNSGRQFRLTPNGALKFTTTTAALAGATEGTMYFDGNSFCFRANGAWVPIGQGTCS